MSKFWRVKAPHSDESQPHCTVCFKVAKRVHLGCSHHENEMLTTWHGGGVSESCAAALSQYINVLDQHAVRLKLTVSYANYLNFFKKRISQNSWTHSRYSFLNLYPFAKDSSRPWPPSCLSWKCVHIEPQVTSKQYYYVQRLSSLFIFPYFSVLF